MPCIEYKGKKYTYEEFGAMLKDGGFSRMSKSGELKLKDLGAQVPSSLLDTTRKGIAPETSSNFANLTTDDEGNFVFFHRGDKGFEQIKPGTGQSGRTPANEAAAIGRVGGVAMYYTTPTDSERMVGGDAQYAVTVAPDEVYDFNEDPDNLIDEARERFKSKFPNMAFDANNQLAYVTKIAGERGYKMVVAEWGGRTRAQTTEAMAPSDVSLKEGDRVVKGFDKKYTTNKQKGFEAVIPETKESRFKKLYNEIYKLRRKENRYDELYRLEEQYPKKTQEEITDLIMNSDLSDDIKQRYQEILSEKEGKRRSEKKASPDKGVSFFEVEGLQEQVDNAKKAMAKLYPELNFVIHDSYDNYNALAKDEEGQESAGFFDAATNTIHINRRAAEDNTVAHETFHAVLFKMFGSDENINKNAKAMLKAIAKEIKSSPQLKRDLDEFIANYDENVKNEEKLTELFAQMAAGYTQLNKKERSLVERFLNKLAELLGLRPFKTDEVLDLLNVLSAKITTGEVVTAEDVSNINAVGVNGVFNTEKSEKKKSILAEGLLERYPDNPNTRVEENVPLSRFNGKRANVFESDRMTGAYISDEKGSKAFNFFGGIFFPRITGKWWASSNLPTAKSIANNSRRDADGYIYGAPIIMAPGSQMSNNDMLLATLEFMKMDVMNKKSSVSKSDLITYIEKAFEKKNIKGKKNILKNALKRTNNIEQIFDEIEYVLFQDDPHIKDRSGNYILTDTKERISKLTFDERREIVSGILGDPKVIKSKFPSAGSMSQVSERFTEPETLKSNRLWDIVVVYRTKGNLIARDTPKSDKFYHKSYPSEILAVDEKGNPAEIEVFMLDGAYNITEVIPKMTKSSGGEFTWEEHEEYVKSGKYKSEKWALLQYGRTSKMSRASGEISVPKKQIKKQIIGENAKLSQQVRDNLTIARQMESAKKSAKTIRLATGWERGADKKWRYEVPDFKLNELVNKNKYVQVSFKDLIKSALTGGLEQYKLSEAVSGDEIFNAYPFLKNVSLVISNSYKKGFQDVLGKGTQAAYFVDNGVKTIAIKPSPDLRSYKEFFESTIAHEVQHAIQDFEGFSYGGDLNSVKLLAITSIEKKLNKNLEEASEEDVEKLKVTKKEKPLKDFVLNTFYSEEDYKNIDKNALELYNKLYGEVEARNVERRMKMTPEERRQVTLQETEDVAREDQIIFFNKNKKQIKKQVSAYHGSPYSFERFTTEKMGTGEGAQAFGWGLYFTDLKGIAEGYASAISASKTTGGRQEYYSEKEFDDYLGNLTNNDDIKKWAKSLTKQRFAKLGDTNYYHILHKDSKGRTFIDTVRDIYNNPKVQVLSNVDFENIIGIDKSDFNSFAKNFERNLYKVSLHKGKTSDQYTWLEWDREIPKSLLDEISKNVLDKTLAINTTGVFQFKKDGVFYRGERNEKGKWVFIDRNTSNSIEYNEVSNAWQELYNEEVLNKKELKFYKRLEDFLESDKKASLFLLESGIDGVKYHAESISRGATSDTARGFNYVVFDENAITIEEQVKFQRSTVAKKIEKALASGMSEAEVVADMVKAGYTEAEARAYIDQYNAMRSDEYNRVKENIKGITEKVEKRAGKDDDPKKIRERKYNDAMNYLQESLWYENADDTQREAAVRELRKDLGFSERQAAPAEKITKGARETITIDSMQALVQSIKDQNRGAKAALKDLKEKREALRDALKSLVKSGKINTRQAAAMINRVMSVNLNNENAVDKLVKYIEKVYNNAELAEKIYNSNSKRKIALRNIKSKIGGAKEAYPILSKLFAIDARNIPLQALEDFSSLVQQFGERKSVLTTEKIATAIQKAQSVLDKVDEDMSRANELSMIFEAFPDAEKKRDANGDILFDKTIEEMKRQGYIDEATAKEMDEYRSDIYRKERATKEEDAQERKDLIDQISSARIVTSSRLSDPNERAYARELIQMARSKSLLKKLSTNTLRNLNAVMGNIDSGYFPNYGVKVYQAMMIEQKAPLVEDVIKNTSTRLISNAYNSAKSALLNLAGGARTAIGETLRQNMSFDIDFMLGDNKGRRIYESIMEPLAKAYSSYETATTELTEKLEKAVALIEGPILKRSPNEVTKVKFKMMAYLLQREYESNAGAKGVAPAIDFIKQTIKEIKGKTTMYSQQDADILKSIADEYSVDGQISADAIFNSLSDREKRALAILEDVNKSMTDIAIFTSGVIRGKRAVMFNNYVPHKVLSGVMSKKEELESVKEAYKKINAIGTKAGSLEERMPGAKAIVFDPFTTSLSSANDVLLEYHMAVPMQTTKRILEKVKKDVIEDENSKDVNIDAINAVMAVREEVAQFVFGTAKSTKDDLFSKADKLIMSNSYRALLAGIPKFANELISNISYVLPQPKNWLTGLKYTFEHADEVMGVELRDIMTLVNSTVTEKVTGRKNVGMISDVGFMGSSNVSHAGKSQGAFKNALETLARNTERPVREIVALIGDKMMSTPDMLVSRPIWVGAMANEFKRQTGVSIDFSRMYDERYRNKYKSAIEAARRVADEEVKMAGSTQNPFDKAAKMNVDTDQSAAKVLAKRMNNFLTNFQMFEFSTARAALYSLVTDGRMGKKKAAAVLAGIELRLIMYSLLGSTITAAFYGLAGYEKDDEEELTWDKLIRSMTSAQIALLVGRNFGNLTKMGQNYAIEELNKENGQMLRDGEEYNPYKHSVVFNKISEKDIEKKGPVRMASVNLSGPYQNIVETMWKIDDISKNEAKTPRSMSQAKKKEREAVKLEPVLDEVLINTASQAGYLPLARDFRPILKGQYKKKGED